MPGALSCLPLLRGIKAIKVSVNVVACNSSTTATVLGTSAARWGGRSSVLVGGWVSLPPHVSVVEPTLACRRPPTRATPSRPARARGLVAEWLAGMAALLRFVCRRPERGGAAVVVPPLSSLTGTC